MHPHHVAHSAAGSRGDVPHLRLCIAAHLLPGPLATRRHRLSLPHDFRSLGRHRRGHALAASVVECPSDDLALRTVAAGDLGIRSRVPRSRDSCRVADDAQLGTILWMRETPPAMRRCDPGVGVAVAVVASRVPGR